MTALVPPAGSLAVSPDERTGFEKTFEALTGKAPFPWQWELFRRLVAGDWPDPISIPTGLGKTSVMAVWALALARDLMDLRRSQRDPLLPRRLAYVVDRRVVINSPSLVQRPLPAQRRNRKHLVIAAGLFECPGLVLERRELTKEEGRKEGRKEGAWQRYAVAPPRAIRARGRVSSVCRPVLERGVRN